MRDLIYLVPKDKHDEKTIIDILNNHKEVRFVSLMGIDLGGNATDEKIPVKHFVENINDYLNYGIQTDGSSVVLQGIATLNNARLDLVPDLDVNWFVDYNMEYIDDEGYPIGTLRIPSFLIHNNKRVGSRSILKRAEENFKEEIFQIFSKYPKLINSLGIKNVSDIENISLTSATELEMWVKTPDDYADLEKLSTSQMLKEQYWKRTQGSVRSAMEESIELLGLYGLEPEMGHKEVGGVKSKIGIDGKSNYVMEQLEIDWKYSNVMQTADNEIIARDIITDVFRRHGLEVTFLAKPLEGVAGSGEHTHVGVTVSLKSGEIKNIFTPNNPKEDYLSEVGYGALMGILKNYEVINPFIAPSNDSFNRLKPGFEAPVCIVASLGKDVKTPTRNRSILVGVIRDMDNPMATRFEVRSPNPLSNTYLIIASLYQTMLDGIIFVTDNDKNMKELEIELSKKPGDKGSYLETSRAYRSEKDVFEHYTEEERNRIFGNPPRTVWENIKSFEENSSKENSLLRGDVFTKNIINSFKLSIIEKWIMELENRIIPNNINILRECKKIHTELESTDLDVVMWEKINNLKFYLMKDSLDSKSLFTKIRRALEEKDYDVASILQIEMAQKMREVKDLYIDYKRNLY